MDGGSGQRLGSDGARVGRRFAVVTLLALGCGSPQNAAPQPLPRTNAAPSPNHSQADCAEALTHRERARAHRVAARRLAALRTFEAAATLCPAEARETEREVGSLREELAPEGSPTVAAGLELLERARTSGDAAQAAWLEERAVVTLEAAEGKRLAPLVPSPGPRKTELFFTPDSERLLERHRDGVCVRRRGAWYPEYVVRTFGNDGEREDSRLSGDGRTLMVPVELQGAAEPRYGSPTFAAAVDVEPGPGFGSERQRLRVNGRAFGFSSDGALFVTAEPVAKRGAAPAHEEIVVADARTFAPARRVPPPAEAQPGAKVGRLALGKRFAVAQWSGGWLSVVELASGRFHAVRGPELAIPDEPLSPDERYAVWADAGPEPRGLVIFETETGATRTARDPTCEGELGPLFDPASSSVAIGGSKSLVCSFELASGRLLRRVRRRQLAAEGGFVVPKRFTPNGAGIYVSNVTHDDQLFDAKSARPVHIGVEPVLGALHARGTNGIVIGRDGRLATLANDLRVASLTPSLAPASVVWSAHTRGDGQVALQLEDRWVLVDPRTGASHPHSLPLWTTLVHTQDGTLVASADRYGPFEVFSEAGGLVPGSPVAYANLERVYRDGDALVVRAEASEWRVTGARVVRVARPPAPATPCSLSRERAPGRFSVVMDDEAPDQHRICDTWTGKRSGSFPDRTRTVNSIVVSDDGSRVALAMEPLSIFRSDTNHLDELPTSAHPRRFVGETRLITSGEVTNSLEVWDLAQKRRIAELKREEDVVTDAYALSPDDRLLFAGRSLWDLGTQRELGRLPESAQGAEFWSNQLLAVVSGARLTLHRVPSLEAAVGMVAARDIDAALAFTLRADASARSVQAFGGEAVWDTTFACAVGNVGVPFRLCREVYGASALLEAALGSGQAARKAD